MRLLDGTDRAEHSNREVRPLYSTALGRVYMVDDK